MDVGAAVEAVRPFVSQLHLNKFTKFLFVFKVAYGIEDEDFIPLDLLSAWCPSCGDWKSLTAIGQFGKLYTHLDLCKGMFCHVL